MLPVCCLLLFTVLPPAVAFARFGHLIVLKAWKGSQPRFSQVSKLLKAFNCSVSVFHFFFIGVGDFKGVVAFFFSEVEGCRGVEGNKRFPVRIGDEGKPYKLFQELGFLEVLGLAGVTGSSFGSCFI